MENILDKKLIPIANQIPLLIADLESAVNWSNKHLNDDLKKGTVEKIKKTRRDLKKYESVIFQKTTTALYGESQVGKPYIIKSLLSNPEGDFSLIDEKSGKKYSFLEDIDPNGNMPESTSLLTRFSTNVDIVDPAFPIKLSLLSPKDVVLILCDSYFSDIINHISLPSPEEITEHITDRKLVISSNFNQKVFTEDEIYDIKDYLEQHFLDFTRNFSTVGFWNFCATNIQKISPEHWWKVFEILWDKNIHISTVFQKLIEALEKLDFQTVVYAEFKSILRRSGSLLNLRRLHELTEELLYEDVSPEDFIPYVNLIYKDARGTPVAYNINKSTLCALTMELTFKLENPFLKNADLLDIPGVRSRLNLQESQLDEANIGIMLSRSKNNYIFHKYSSEFRINNLLFCVSNRISVVKNIPRLLNTWIEKNIGSSPDLRQEVLSNTSVPPLFIIYTSFNQDISYDVVNDRDEKALSLKWVKRFNTIFENDIVTDTYDWHKNWMRSKPFFQNSFMIRDFYYSSSIYTGYNEQKQETGVLEIGMPNYLNKLRHSFVEYDFVKKHFVDPNETWEEAATMNKDGSKLITYRLSEVANNAIKIRKIVYELNKTLNIARNELAKHYHSSGQDQDIQKAAKKAGQIQLNMDIVFGRTPDIFGKFIKSLILDKNKTVDAFNTVIHDNRRKQNPDIDFFTLVKTNVPEISLNKSYAENCTILRKAYNFDSIEALEQYFAEKEVDLKELFYGTDTASNDKAYELAQMFRFYWFDNNLKKEHFQFITDLGFSSKALDDLFDNIKLSFQKLRVTEIIAQNIREDLDEQNFTEDAGYRIMDISVATINKFITSMGWDFYSPSTIDFFKKANEENDLSLNFTFNNKSEEIMDNEGISKALNKVSRYNEIISQVNLDQEVVTNLPNIVNIIKWRSLMKISFIANCDIPTYDIKINSALGELINKLGEYQFKVEFT